MSKIHKKIIFTFLLIFYCYLCIIKIREYMNDILMNRGFIKTENPNEYVRRDWTIRINGDIIEAFNDPDKNKGLYYSGPVKLVDIEQLLIEIDEFIKL